MNVLTKRRKRHRLRLLHSGKRKAVRKHRRRGGRTGSILAKSTPSSQRFVRAYSSPNPPFSGWGTR